MQAHSSCTVETLRTAARYASNPYCTPSLSETVTAPARGLWHYVGQPRTPTGEGLSYATLRNLFSWAAVTRLMNHNTNGNQVRAALAKQVSQRRIMRCSASRCGRQERPARITHLSQVGRAHEIRGAGRCVRGARPPLRAAGEDNRIFGPDYRDDGLIFC